MMRPYFLLILFLFPVMAAAGQKTGASERLYYFKSKGLTGVKDGTGRIIIPAIHENWPEHRNGEPVTTHLILLWPKGDTSERRSFGVVYDRKGKLLFRPFDWDHGPDEFSEGQCRFVKAGKTGFVNRSGEVTIPAQFTDASAFEYGIASYCNDCVWKSDGDHALFVSGHWTYINYKGKKIQPIPKKKFFRDQKIDSVTYLPYQFTYSPFEQKILGFFQRQSMIANAHFADDYSALESSERQLYYEIVERPSAAFPYYQVVAFSLNNGRYSSDVIDGLKFLVSRNGRQVYFLTYDDKKIPFSQWLKSYVAAAKSFKATS